MTNLITDVARYVMIFLIAFYTYLNFRYFSLDEERQNRLCGRQNRIMVLIQILAYGVMYLRTEDIRLPLFAAVQIVFFVAYILLYRVFYPYVSRILVNNVCIFLSIGLFMLSRLSFEKAERQFVIVVVSAVFTWIIPFIMDRVWQLVKIPWVYGILGLVLLGVVCLVGNTSFGAQLSIEIAGVTMQPSEFVKLSFVFFVASMLYQSTEWKQVVKVTVMAALHVLILVLSKDLGSAFIFFVTYLFMLFVATSNWLYLTAGSLSGCLAGVAAYGLFQHVRVRVMAWRDPWSDIENKGYQVAQSLFAIGTGSWFGMGLFQGQPDTIPVASSDFIFSAICEEMGLIFGLCMTLVCVSCYVMFLNIAMQLRSMFYKLVALGLGTCYIFQVFLNIGGVTKFIPSTGVTLPLVSYGGSSILSTLIMFAIIQGLYILREDEEEDIERKKKERLRAKRSRQESAAGYREAEYDPQRAKRSQKARKEAAQGKARKKQRVR